MRPIGCLAIVAILVVGAVLAVFVFDLTLSDSAIVGPAVKCPTDGPTTAVATMTGIPDEVFAGNIDWEIVWDPTIRLVSIHVERDLGDDRELQASEDGPAFGFNLWLEPIEPKDDGTCKAEVLNADFTIADRSIGTPDEINVHSYVMNEDPTCPLVIESVTTSAITGVLQSGCVTLQEMDVFGKVGGTWSEGVSFTAVER